MELPGVRRLYKRYGRYLDHRRVRAGLRKVHVVSEYRADIQNSYDIDINGGSDDCRRG